MPQSSVSMSIKYVMCKLSVSVKSVKSSVDRNPIEKNIVELFVWSIVNYLQ